MKRHHSAVKLKNRSPKAMRLRSSNSSKCCVFSCRNSIKETQKTRPTLEYFPFPKDKSVLASWRKFCNKVEDDCEDSFVCADHFIASDFMDTTDKSVAKRGSRSLKPDAVPSIYKQELKSEETGKVGSVKDGVDFGRIRCGSTCALNKVQSSTSHLRMKSSSSHPTKKTSSQDISIIDCSSPIKEKFVSLLKEHSIILDTSVAARVRFRKTRALKKLAFAYKKRFGRHITRFKLRKKIEEMMAYIRDKLNRMKTSPSDNQLRLNKWEDEFVKLLQAKKVPLTPVGSERFVNSSRTFLPYSQQSPRNVLKSLVDRKQRSTSLSAETDETLILSNEQLHRLLTLEQLKLIRLQQLQSQREIERLK